MHAVHLNACIVPSPVYDSDLYRFIIAQLHIHFYAWLSIAFSIWEGSIMHHWDLPYLPLRDFVLSKRSAFVPFGPPETGATSKGETPTFVLEQD